MATSGEKRWPPVGNFVAASGEKPMAIHCYPSHRMMHQFLSRLCNSLRRARQLPPIDARGSAQR